MENLTKEEAIRRHRLLWNYIADQIEEEEEVPWDCKKEAFEHFGWHIYDALSLCWCCEYAKNLWEKDETDEEKCFCDFCPLDWSGGENIIDATCANIPSNLVIEGSLPVSMPGLYGLWFEYSNLIRNDRYEPDIGKSVVIARTIANLPEKKEVKEHD